MASDDRKAPVDGSALEEQQLRERQRAIFDTAVDAIVSIDEHGTVDDMNAAAERMFGYGAGEIVGRNVSMLMPEPDRSHHDRYIARYLETGEPHVVGGWREVDALRKDGTRFRIEIGLGHWEAGGHHGFAAIMRDVTTQRQTEIALARSESLLREAQRLAHVGSFFGRPPFGREDVEWSDELYRIMGLSKDEGPPSLKEIFGLMHPEDRERVFAAVGPQAQLDEPVTITNRIRRPDGTVRFVRMHVQQRHNDAGEIESRFGVVYDITELREAEALREVFVHKALLAQEDERRRIARELHDESGQVLSALTLGLEELRQSTSPVDLRARAAKLQSLAQRAMDGLDRLARGLHPRLLDDLGLGEAIQHHADEVGRTHQLDVEVQAVGLEQEELPRPIATTLYRIIQEALTNVARHAEAQAVSIVVQRHGNHVRALVEDDGRGFDVSQTSRGMGLLGIKERVKLLGGTVDIESVPGNGTTVAVRIPIEAVEID